VILSIRGASASTRAAAAVARQLDTDTRKGIKARTRALIVDPMRSAARARARRPLHAAVAATARASFWRDIPGVAFGGTRAVTTDGTSGRVVAHGTEYGSDGTRRATFRVRSPRGRVYSVTRRTSVQFRPRTPGGSFVAPAVDSVAPDVVDAWSDLVVDAAVVMLDELAPTDRGR
jgi:hypothetical protein